MKALLILLFIPIGLFAQKKVALIFQKGHHEPIATIAASPDGKTLATGGTDMMIRFRDLESGIEFNTFRAKQWNIMGENARIAHLEFSKDNQFLLCFVRSDVMDQLLLLRVKDNKVLLESIQDGNDRNLSGGFFTPDGKSVVFCKGMSGKYMAYYDLKTLKPSYKGYYNIKNTSTGSYTVEHWTSFKFGVYFTPDQQTALTISPDWGADMPDDYESGEVVFLMDANTGKPKNRVLLPSLEDGRAYTVVPGKNNQFFYAIPENALDWNKVYWHKYDLATGAFIDSMGPLLEEQENVVMNHCMTPQGQFIYNHYDSIYVCNPGEVEIVHTWSAKGLRGNTSKERVQHLGDITALSSSANGKSVFVAFAGSNRARGGSHFTHFKGDFKADVITIRQIDLATGQVLREYASLGKMINAMSFDPRGKSLWLAENESSYAPDKPSLLNIWKFREVGNLPTTELSSDEIQRLTFSPNKRQCFVEYVWLHASGVVQTKDYSYSDLKSPRKENLEGQQLFTKKKQDKKVRYKEHPVAINQSYTAAIDEEFRLYKVSQNNIDNNQYIGQLKPPKHKKRLRPNSHFMNEGKEVAILQVGTIQNYEKVSANNILHFYDVNTAKKTGQLNMGAMFWDFGEKNAVATNKEETLFAIAAEEEFKTRQERIANIYIIDAVQHQIKTKIPLKVDDCFYWKYNDHYSKNICAPVEVSALEFSPDSKLIVGGWGDHQVKIWEVETGKLLTSLKGHLSLVSAVSFHPKKAIMATASEDAQVIFWNTENWSVIAKMILVGQDDYILYTDDGYYMATQNALDWVAFKKDQRLFSFEQFDLKFNRPDILMDSLDLASSIMNRMLQKAYDKRLQKMGYTREMLDHEFHVPTLSIANHLPFEVQEANLEFDVLLEDTKEPLNRLNVYVNDVPIYGLLGKSLSANQNSKQKETIQLQLSQGLNEITLSVTNKKGAESLKKKTVIAYNNIDQKATNLHIVVVGVSNYKDSIRNLTFASKDANDIAQAFSKQTQHYQQIHTHILTNEEATTERVLAELEALKKTSVDDEIILYFSCHGLLDDQLNYYLAMYPTNFETPKQGGLSYQKLEAALAHIPARKRLMFIDACHSGEVDKTAVELQQKETFDNQDISMRSKSGNYNLRPKIGLNNSFAYMQTLFSNVTKGTGTTIISAAGGMEFALESKDWNNSAFTYAILEGLKSKKADLDEDGVIKISELQKYVTFNVHKLTNGKQVPTTRHVNRANDFLIYRF